MTSRYTGPGKPSLGTAIPDKYKEKEKPVWERMYELRQHRDQRKTIQKDPQRVYIPA